MKYQTIETKNYHFQFIEQGKGFPLLFIPGYPGRPEDFRWLFPELSSFKIISLAMPNLGATITKEEAVSPTTIEQRSEAIHEFIRAKKIEKCLVVAHSMGGAIATSFATDYPTIAKGLVLIASVGPWPYVAFRKSKPDLAHRLLSIKPLEPLFRLVMKQVFYWLGFPKGISVESMKYVLHCAHDFSFETHRNNLKEIGCPVLSIWSENDPMIEAKSQKALFELLQYGSALQFSKGKHNPQRIFPKEIAEKIRVWIDEHSII